VNPAQSSSWQGRVAYALLLVMIVLTPWPWGSVGTPAQSTLLLLTGAALALCQFAAESRRWPQGRTFRLGVAAWIIWLMWLASSLIPLPPSWLGSLSPSAYLLHQSVATLGVEPAYTLSTEPVASRADLLTATGLFGLYLLAASCVRSARRRQGLLIVLALVAGLQALYGLGMTMTGKEIGFLEKKIYGRGWATGTFVNRNHFAHLLALGAAATLALLMASRSPAVSASGWRGMVLRLLNWVMSSALVWRVLLLALLSATVLSQSRMGNVVLPVILIFGVLLWTALHDRGRLLTAGVLLASFAVADLWIVNRYYGLERVANRLEETELETEQRTVALRDLQPLIETYALTGSGGGSFQSAFLAHQSPQLKGLYDHAHNEYAEFAIEHGLPGLAWVLVMGLLHFGHALRLLALRRNPATRAIGLAGAMALLAVALHALSDFILHIPALRTWVVVFMGVLAGASAKAYASRRGRAQVSGLKEEVSNSGLIP